VPDIRCGRSTPVAERAVWYAAIAQLVEHVIRNDGVTGSNPVCGTALPSKPVQFHPKNAADQCVVYRLSSKCVGILTILLVYLLVTDGLPPRSYRPAPPSLNPKPSAACSGPLQAMRSRRKPRPLLALTFARPGENRAGEWSEFDLDNAIWSTPAAKMKRRCPHRIPLAPRAVTLLRELRGITGNGRFVFRVQSIARALHERKLAGCLEPAKIEVRLGSSSTELGSLRHVRVYPDSGRRADIPVRQLRGQELT
jgi:hypothetical protein